MEISVVIPVYGCKNGLKPLHERLTASLGAITNDYEIILVNDCCPQNSWEEIRGICERDSRVTGINFSRNFGQIRAITAGLDQSKGDWVVVMDCDLQDRPEDIEILYNKAKEGYDVVFCRREHRKGKLLTKFFSGMFYKAFSYFTDSNYDPQISNFSICRRIVIDNYCKMREQNRAYAIFIRWLGFDSAFVNIEHNDRIEGKSSYSFRRRINLAMEIITAQSNKMLQLSIKIGFAMSLISLIVGVYHIVANWLTETRVNIMGWTSMFVSMFFLAGLVLINLGVIGIYIGNIFDEVKSRPLYVIKDILNRHK